jgi:hypothetical protein
MSSCVTVTNTLVDSRIAVFGYGGESEIYYLVCVSDRVVCNGRYPGLSIGTFNVLVVVIASVFDWHPRSGNWIGESKQGRTCLF